MLRLTKQIFIGLLRFSGSLATKGLSLNNEPSMVRPTLIDQNPVELKYYSWLIQIKCSGICNATNDLSTKICVPSKTKDVNVEVFNIITRINEAKKLVNIFQVILNAITIKQHVIQIKNGKISRMSI